jgi:hypothetical protein
MDSPALDLREVESFGGIDADTDQLLDECFDDHEAYFVRYEIMKSI